MKIKYYYICISLIYFILTPFVYSVETTFTVSSTDEIIAIGHPIDLIFETRNHSRSLSSINLDTLEKYFVIHDYNINKYEETISGELVRIENLIVRIYPKKSGTLRIPSFKLGNNISKVFSIKIINDFNSMIQIRVNSIKKEYYENEPISIYIDIFYRQKKISTSIKPFNNKNFIISELAKSEYSIRNNGVKTVVNRYSWIVIPLQPGAQTLVLPMVKTGGRKLYPSGKLKLKIKALASTLPAHIPVSKQVITHNYYSQDSHLINTIYFWNLRINGNGLNENILEKIIAPQLESNDMIRYFPRSYTQTRINNGLLFKTFIKIPFKMKKSGLFNFPIIDIPYIDENTTNIEHSYSSQLSIKIKDPYYENLKTVFLFFLLFIITFIPILNFLKRKYIIYRYKMCYYFVLLSNDPQQIKHLIFKWTPLLKQNIILTIKEWQESVIVNHNIQFEVIAKISVLLNNFNYGKSFHKSEMATLKKLLRSLI